MGVSSICVNYDKRISMPFYVSDRIIVLFCSFIVHESMSSSLRIIVAFTGFMKMSMRTIASYHSPFNGSLFSAIAACFFCDIISFIVNKKLSQALHASIRNISDTQLQLTHTDCMRSPVQQMTSYSFAFVYC